MGLIVICIMYEFKLGFEASHGANEWTGMEAGALEAVHCAGITWRRHVGCST